MVYIYYRHLNQLNIWYRITFLYQISYVFNHNLIPQWGRPERGSTKFILPIAINTDCFAVSKIWSIYNGTYKISLTYGLSIFNQDLDNNEIGYKIRPLSVNGAGSVIDVNNPTNITQILVIGY